MFSLLYGFWEYLSRKEEIRVLILGLDKAGARHCGITMEIGALLGKYL